MILGETVTKLADKQTTGTWVAIAINLVLAIVGVLQATDWVHLVGSPKAGTITSILALVNICLHYFTGDVAKV